METIKLYYQDVFLKEFESSVSSCEENGKNHNIVLEATAFYPEGGGQPSDSGIIKCDDGRIIHVIHAYEKDGLIIHTCDGAIKEGEKVTGLIDWKKRFDHMQQHSGEHIVSGMLCAAFDCDNVGFHMGADVVTIDYNADIAWDDVLKIEEKANTYIWEDHDFVEMFPTEDELKDLPYRFKKEIEGQIRITSFPGADMCACCGTHVKSSGQVGLVKFISCQKFKNGVRLELLCGARAFAYLNENLEQNRAIASDMSTKYDKTFSTYIKMKEEFAGVRAAFNKLEEEYFEKISDSYKDRGDVLFVTGEMEGDSIRKLASSIAEKSGGLVCAFAGNDLDGGNYKYVIMHPGNDIKDLVKEINQGLNGRGGGRDGFAQGSVKSTKTQIMCLDRFKNLGI